MAFELLAGSTQSRSLYSPDVKFVDTWQRNRYVK